LYGNPYKLPEADRAKWTDGLDLEPYSEQEYLLYVGCVGSYDERGQKSARAVAALLKTMRISFGILGSEERCDGNELKSMGEKGLFELIAQENIQKYKELGVKKIVTLSPHSYHAFKNEYPLLGGDFEVFHYSQLAARTIRKIGFKRAEVPTTVTFHDPCYLGRHNKEYEAARKILGALPGVQLKEMDRAGKDALCCGGGGGNVFTDILGAGPHSSARVRAREAAGTGAQVLAVACPGCARMLDDAVKAESLQDNLQVMDLAELVATRIAPE
jgi:Fe-S oxidoreductase